jgi:hypothetical protein
LGENEEEFPPRPKKIKFEERRFETCEYTLKRPLLHVCQVHRLQSALFFVSSCKEVLLVFWTASSRLRMALIVLDMFCLTFLCECVLVFLELFFSFFFFFLFFFFSFARKVFELSAVSLNSYGVQSYFVSLLESADFQDFSFIFFCFFLVFFFIMCVVLSRTLLLLCLSHVLFS